MLRFIYSKGFKVFFSIFLIVAVLIVSDSLGYLQFIKSQVWALSGGASRFVAFNAGKIKNFGNTFLNIRKLASENAELSQKVNELSFENARLIQARQENTALRKALDLKETGSFALIPAEVTLYDPTGFSQSIVINKGTDSGIASGDSVIVAPGLIAGIVYKAHPDYSEVKLITDPSMTIDATVVESQAQGLVRGEHGLSLSLELVTQNEVIKTGDLLVTSGLTPNIPKGLLIGEIVTIYSTPSDLFQRAYVMPTADLNRLKFVFVAK